MISTSRSSTLGRRRERHDGSLRADQHRRPAQGRRLEPDRWHAGRLRALRPTAVLEAKRMNTDPTRAQDRDPRGPGRRRPCTGQPQEADSPRPVDGHRQDPRGGRLHQAPVRGGHRHPRAAPRRPGRPGAGTSATAWLAVLVWQGTCFINSGITPFGITGDDEAFCHFNTEKAGVTAVPVRAFMRKGSIDTLIRFCFCKKDDVFDAAADRLQCFLN